MLQLSILTQFYSVAIPALFIFSANAYTLWNEHWEHEAHRPPPSERPQYPYLNIRAKPYPWGDGDKVRWVACVATHHKASSITEF
jgi:cytochrome c oxidase subunit 6a